MSNTNTKSVNSRELCVQKLNEFIEDKKICKRIEESIYKYSNDKAKERCIQQNINDDFFKRIYVNKLHQIYLNLKPDSGLNNKYFLDRILSEEFDIDNIAFLSPQQIHPEHWSILLQRQNAAEELASNSGSGTLTEEFTCGRCKGNKTRYLMVQDRGADESASIYITCSSCNKKWRIRG